MGFLSGLGRILTSFTNIRKTAFAATRVGVGHLESAGGLHGKLNRLLRLEGNDLLAALRGLDLVHESGVLLGQPAPAQPR
ncbi:MAG: hypothetical protein JKY65_19630 [Planctomycetes bacterium]|nr:hypothetical protein [Planctomycetota bacterium]